MSSVTLMMMPMLLLLLQLTAASEPAPTVDAPWGRVQGTVVAGDGPRTLHGYLGIPFAVPPVGDRRFEKPEAHPGLEDGEVFVADKIAPACFQIPGLIGKERAQSEDCLILDIYVPTTPSSSPRSVMFFIHGGGFSLGDSSFYRSSKLVADEDVILVSIQYRLGVFGFLITGDAVIPPNLGLFDQVLALQWVKDNIAAFGGDPDTITIFGESAGSMSVGMLTLSPYAKGLFVRAIEQSGSPTGLLALSDMISPEVFVNMSKALDCDGQTTEDRVTCLKKMSGKDFHEKSAEFSKTLPIGGFSYPVVDGDFIPASPKEMLEDDELRAKSSLEDVETVIGFNNQEGALILMTKLMFNLTDDMLRSQQFFQKNVYQCFMFAGLTPSPVLAKTVEFFYRGANSGEEPVEVEDLGDMYGDCLLTVNIIDWAIDLAASPHSGPLYVYVMEHDFSCNKNCEFKGSHHGDELAFLFDAEQTIPKDSMFAMMNKTGPTEEEKPMASMLVRLFASFAQTGKPELISPGKGEWPQFTEDAYKFLSISTSPSVVDDLGKYKNRWALWHKFLPELTKVTDEVKGQGSGQADGKQDGKDEL